MYGTRVPGTPLTQRRPLQCSPRAWTSPCLCADARVQGSSATRTVVFFPLGAETLTAAAPSLGSCVLACLTVEPQPPRPHQCTSACAIASTCTSTSRGTDRAAAQASGVSVAALSRGRAAMGKITGTLTVRVPCYFGALIHWP